MRRQLLLADRFSRFPGAGGSRETSSRSARPSPAVILADRRDPHTYPADNGNHSNLYGSATFPRMIRLCIAQDHETAALHSSGLDIWRKLNVIMGLSYAKSSHFGVVALA